jgi:two-component system chemotaxis sensor kinase CheA
VTTDPTLVIFFEETDELLKDAESLLLRMEETPADKELLNRLFRAAHTIKGTSGMLGFDAVAVFTHSWEDVMDRLRHGDLDATHDVIDTLLGAMDVVKALISEAKGEHPCDRDQRDQVLARLRSYIQAQPAPRPPAEAQHPQEVQPQAAAAATAAATETATEIVAAATATAAAATATAAAAAAATAAAVSQAAPAPAPALSLPPAAPAPAAPALAKEPAPGTIAPPATPPPAPASATPPPAPASATPPSAPASATPPSAPAAATPPSAPAAATPPPAPAAATPPPASRLSQVPAPAPGQGQAHLQIPGAESASIRVPIEKVDRLINLVGELVSTQSMVAQLVSGFSMDRLLQLEEAVTLMDRHSRELQERVMAIRMLPIKTLFSRFQRVVRDLAGLAGKQIALEVTGEETELDKTVIEKIGDPMTHLIRNAVDHGIETPEARVSRGKPPAGRLRLSAYQRGGNIYIEVSDDGKGLDRERILQKAVQLDLVRPDKPLSDAEVFSLIFHPGLSTAERITEISGRGVGMDVVKRNIEALKGTISIDSEKGKGTCFRIKLPLTLAILDGLALQVGQQNYIVPLVSIVESVRPQPGDVRTVLGKGEVINVRGEYLPLLRLYEIFGIESTVTDPVRGLVVITDDGSGKLAFLVDELLGQFQVVIKSLESNFRKVFGIAGATILGDGRVALILDVAGLQQLTRTAKTELSLPVHVHGPGAPA